MHVVNEASHGAGAGTQSRSSRRAVLFRFAEGSADNNSKSFLTVSVQKYTEWWGGHMRVGLSVFVPCPDSV